MRKDVFLLLAMSIHMFCYSALDRRAGRALKRYANKPIKTYTYSKKLSRAGTNNCDSTQNGESFVIQTFIKKNSIVFDVGAHVGDWTKTVLIATHSQCTIYAFEPLPEFYACLEDVRLSFNAHVSTFNVALGNENKTVEMNQFLPGSVGIEGCSSLFDRPVLRRFPSKKVTVRMTSLNTFVAQHNIGHIDFLKIDTEGTELAILLGASNLIKNNGIDIIQFEYGGTYPDAHITLFQVYSYLTENNYLIFRIIPDGLIYVPTWDESLENAQYSNYLALRQRD